MFHLGGPEFPATREQLVEAVREGLRGLLSLPPGREVVRIDGGAFPAFERVSVDLTAARTDADRLPPEPRGTGQRKPGVSTRRLEVIGKPFYIRQAAIELSLGADDARFDFDRDATGRPVLVLTDARNGQISLQTRKQDLDGLVLSAAKDAASKQGVQILETNLVLTQIDDRSVAADVRVKAKKMFLTATVSLHGKLAVDDALNAKLYDLTVTGAGALGDMASNLLRPHLQQVNGKSFPLTAFSLGQVRLRDLRLKVGDVPHLTAAFGS